MKVITFSTKFPATHPRKGEPTDFVQKIWSSLLDLELISLSKCCELSRQTGIGDLNMNNIRQWRPEPKGHTIRAGNRWKVGDWFQPVIWGNDINPNSGRSGPYQSKQIKFAPPIEVKKTWDIMFDNFSVPSINGIHLFDEYNNQNWDFDLMAKNDGLTTTDAISWFKPYKETVCQIICWNEQIEY